VRLAFSRRGSILAGVAKDNTCRLWSFPSLKEFMVFPLNAQYLPSLEFSKTDRLLGIGHDDGVDIWDVISKQKLATLQTTRIRVLNLSISRDETRVATAGSDGKVHLWQIPTNKKITTFHGQLSTYNAVGFSPDDQRLAACGADGRMTFWDTTTFQEVASLKLEPYELEGFDFLEDQDDSLAVKSRQRFFILRAPKAEDP
jgi:WD40 repeat protein